MRILRGNILHGYQKFVMDLIHPTVDSSVRKMDDIPSRGGIMFKGHMVRTVTETVLGDTTERSHQRMEQSTMRETAKALTPTLR